MKFLPLVVVGMYPGLYARAVETITNMTRANYFYIIGYGNYSGYRVEHDPTLTLYMTTSTTPLSLPPWVGIEIIVGAAGIIIIVSSAIVLRRRKPETSETKTVPPLPSS